MAVDLQGNIIDEEGNKSGQTVDLDTGQVSGTITSDLFGGGSQIDLGTLPKVNVGSIPPIEEVTLTGEESKAQDLSTDIESLTERLLGRSEFESTQEETQDIAGKEALTTSLRNQIKSLGLESQDLALQVGEAAQRIQEESTGRGRTAGGVAPLTASAQRVVNLKQAGVRSQILITQGLLYAAEGDLASAEKAVADAVAQKYGPIEEELEVKIDNYNRIINSPKASVQEKNRARELKARDEARANVVAENKALENEVLSIATEAATETKDALLLKRIREAVDENGNPDPVEAQRLATAAGLGAEDDPFDVTVKLAPEDIRDLTGAGFSTSDISSIQRDVDEFGIDAVLEGMTDQRQIAAIQNAYGVQAQVTAEQIDSLTTQKEAQVAIEKAFTDDEIEQMAIDAGFARKLLSRAKERENYLNSERARQDYIDILTEQYRTSGQLAE
jgi:hypothetical protein